MAKKAKEGEERSEEDCEEDPQGLQEEVNRFPKIAGDLMPARHKSLQDDLLLEADFG